MKEKIVRDSQMPFLFGKPVMMAYKGKRPIRRYVRVAGGRLTPAARFLWEQSYPNDPVRPGEELHHKDFNPLNDTLSNLEKLSEFEHRMIHKQRVKNLADDSAKNLRIATEIRNAIESRKIRTPGFNYDTPGLVALG